MMYDPSSEGGGLNRSAKLDGKPGKYNGKPVIEKFVSLSDVPQVHGTMKLAELLKLPPYKGQRDTDRHADAWEDDPNFDPNHPTLLTGFALIQMPKGPLVVGNGNTRIELHRRGVIVLPDLIPHSVKYKPRSNAEAERIYRAFDNRAAAKDSCDNGTTGLKLAGFNVAKMHPLFKGGAFQQPLGYAVAASRGNAGSHGAITEANVTATAKKWHDEIEWLNELLLKHNIPFGGKIGKVACASGVIAAALKSYRLALSELPKPTLPEVRAFWDRFYSSKSVVGEARTAHNWLWRELALFLANTNIKRRSKVRITLGEATYAVEHHDRYVEKGWPRPGTADKLR